MVERTAKGKGFRERERERVRSPRNSQESQLTPAGSRDLRGGEDKQRHKRGEGGRGRGETS